MSDKKEQNYDTENSYDIQDNLGSIIVLNKGTSEEHYLWNDGGKIQEICDLSDNLKQLIGGIMIRLE